MIWLYENCKLKSIMFWKIKCMYIEKNYCFYGWWRWGVFCFMGIGMVIFWLLLFCLWKWLCLWCFSWGIFCCRGWGMRNGLCFDFFVWIGNVCCLCVLWLEVLNLGFLVGILNFLCFLKCFWNLGFFVGILNGFGCICLLLLKYILCGIGWLGGGGVVNMEDLLVLVLILVGCIM